VACAKRLQLLIYEPKSHSSRTVPALESDKKDSLFNYFKRDQEFHYTRWQTQW